MIYLRNRTFLSTKQFAVVFGGVKLPPAPLAVDFILLHCFSWGFSVTTLQSIKNLASEVAAPANSTAAKEEFTHQYLLHRAPGMLLLSGQ